jgi:hypothetical protein
MTQVASKLGGTIKNDKGSVSIPAVDGGADSAKAERTTLTLALSRSLTLALPAAQTLTVTLALALALSLALTLALTLARSRSRPRLPRRPFASRSGFRFRVWRRPPLRTCE